VFDVSLKRIREVNSDNLRHGRQWLAGVHPFMDWTESERTALKGYKPNRRDRSASRFSALQVSVGSSGRVNQSWSSIGMGSSWEGIALRDQGMCGSCWAISAVEAIEARLPGNTRVSAQALVDCVPNPQHCGGTGGCDGATGELAYQYIRDNGLPLESNYEYTGKDSSCKADIGSSSSQRVKLTGWTNLESNKVQPLMEALYNSGPVVVAVDADKWLDYGQGIFDSCVKDATLDHAVLAKGYGGEGNAMWWLIQNSWGSGWGEQGHIRLKRRDTAGEEAYCGRDRKPSEGVGCDGGPAEVTVCGSCGLLYDPIFPEGVTLEGATDSRANPIQNLVITDVKREGSDRSSHERQESGQPQLDSGSLVNWAGGTAIGDKQPIEDTSIAETVTRPIEENPVDRMKQLFHDNFLQTQ